MYNFAASESVCVDTGSLMSLCGRSTECTVHGFCKHAPYLVSICIKNYSLMFIIYRIYDVEDMSRMCIVLPIRNFYRYLHYGKKRVTLNYGSCNRYFTLTKKQ